MTATVETETMRAHDWVKEAHNQVRAARRALLEALYGLEHPSYCAREDAAVEVIQGIDSATAAESHLYAALKGFGVEPYPDGE